MLKLSNTALCQCVPCRDQSIILFDRFCC